MARDGWRVFLWDDGEVDARFARTPAAVGLAAGGPSLRETVASLELPAKSIAAGTLLALLYGWPIAFAANIFMDFGPRTLAVILAACALVGSVASFWITAWEPSRWQRSRERLSDHADPPPWK
jgi:hypothetical protein